MLVGLFVSTAMVSRAGKIAKFMNSAVISKFSVSEESVTAAVAVSNNNNGRGLALKLSIW